MNEELTVAIEELRQRPTSRSWFIPVSIDGAVIPARSIGGGETLQDLHWVDLTASWDRSVDLIAQSVVAHGTNRELHDHLALNSLDYEDSGLLDTGDAFMERMAAYGNDMNDRSGR